MAKVNLQDPGSEPVESGSMFSAALSQSALGESVGSYVAAVTERSSVPRRAAEAARMRIAEINGCMLCMSARLGADDDGLTAEFYEHVGDWASWPGYSASERLAIEFAERFALDHRLIDDDLWSRLGAEFTQEQIVDLGLSVAEWLGIGRFTQVLGLDRQCTPASM
jgi:alkylhydroperoxidase family enzyme